MTTYVSKASPAQHALLTLIGFVLRYPLLGKGDTGQSTV